MVSGSGDNQNSILQGLPSSVLVERIERNAREGRLFYRNRDDLAATLHGPVDAGCDSRLSTESTVVKNFCDVDSDFRRYAIPWTLSWPYWPTSNTGAVSTVSEAILNV